MIIKSLNRKEGINNNYTIYLFIIFPKALSIAYSYLLFSYRNLVYINNKVKIKECLYITIQYYLLQRY